MKKGGGLGLIVLIIAMAIVLYLWASNAKEVMPTLQGASQKVEEIAGPGELPRLEQMKEATAEHASELQEALEESGK